MPIENHDDLADSPARELVLDCIAAGIEVADPERAVDRALSVGDGPLAVEDRTVDLNRVDRVVVLGGGKASAGMARAVARTFEAAPAGTPAVDGGCVVVPDPAEIQLVETVVGAHPIPDEAGQGGAKRVLELAAAADEHTLVVGVFSGGGSALLPAPAGSISLADLRATTRALVECGADIGTINAVRKHISAIKGGRLAVAAAPAPVVSLVVSDVVGDDPAVVASGPTAPDTSTFGDAVAALQRLDVSVPDAVRSHLSAGAGGHHPETPGPGDSRFEHVSNHVVAGNGRSVEAAAHVPIERERAENPEGALDLGNGDVAVNVLTTRLRGRARQVAGDLVTAAEAVAAGRGPIAAPAVLLAGGETTVRVTDDGAGGPNQALCLHAALALASDRVTLGAVDTDGLDGSSEAAGALVDADTVDDASAARAALDRDDAGGYLADRDALIHTGPTGTNVNDLAVIVIEGTDGN